MKNWMLILAALSLLVLGAACGGSDDSGQQNTAQAQGEAQAASASGGMAASSVAADVKANCVKCHGMQKICDKIGQADMPEWGATLGFMMSKGASLGSSSVTDMAEFLADEAKARPALCE